MYIFIILFNFSSIKFINYEKHIEFIELYNKIVEEKQRIALEYYNIDTNLLYPKTINGKIKIPGVWDYEGKYSRFKTLGAKRYLVEQDNKLTLTCAGLSKQNGINYLLDQAGNDNTKVFEMFNDEMTIPALKKLLTPEYILNRHKERLASIYLY